jgi:apolipoprotein D and lipocalin family protein
MPRISASLKKFLWLTLLLVLAGCASTGRPPIATVEGVDLKRFTGDWYVIAHIPTFIERNAYNAVERYDWNPNGTIATTFTFRDGAFDGAQRQFHPTGFVTDFVHHSTWAMQFVWPFKSEFLIASLDPDYRQTIIARNARDFVWIMARTPSIPDADYDRLVAEVKAMGYDVSVLRKVPQRW